MWRIDSPDRPYYYVLDEHGEAQPCADVMVWGQWFERTKETGERIIARDKDEAGGVDVMVSTVFLALDHAFTNGPPILWETLVFGGLLDGEMQRYSSRAAALIGHQRMCARVRQSLGK